MSCSLRNTHSGAQSFQGPFEPGFNTGHRDAERDGHVGERQVKVEVQKNGDPLVVGQLVYCATKVFTLEPAGFVEGLNCPRISKPNHLPPSASADFPALVGDNGNKPRLERTAVAKIP